MSDRAQKTEIPKKPLLFADNPFNDMRVRGMDINIDRADASFVPGYSDVRMANEIRRAKKQPLLPQSARAQWVRVTKRTGENVNITDEGMSEWMRLGYVAAGLDDLRRLGWEMPPTATVGPDGLIRRGDLALFYVDAERAEENRDDQRAINREMAQRELKTDNPEIRDVVEERMDKRGTLKELAQLELPTADK